jgi:hypothetical protein
MKATYCAQLSLALFLATLPLHAATTFSRQVAGRTIAVVVYAQNEAAKAFERNALSRLENILTDNNVTVMDRRKAEDLKNVFTNLDDPGAFVTAETFVENAGKFKIQGLAALYLNVDAEPGLADYYTATAHADIRFISEADAKVQSLSTTPMGAPGRPPSDGLTANSALLNAMQRAIDDACGKLGLQVMDPATPRSVRLTLEGPVDKLDIDFSKRKIQNESALAALANMEKQKLRVEKPTCTTVAPGGSLAAVAGYIIDTDFMRRPQRLYGSRVHLVDTRQRREISVLDCHPVEKREVRHRGTRQVLDTRFLLNWRHVAAVTGNTLFLWDTERGMLMAETDLPKAVKSATLHFAKGSAGSFLVVDGGRRQVYTYRITRK